MLKNSHASALVVAALLALATLLVLPTVLVAKTEPPLAEVVPSKMASPEAAETTNSEAEETTNSSSGVDKEPEGPGLQQLALEKLTLEETTPAPEPVPEKTTSKKHASKKSGSKKQASEKSAPDPEPAPVSKQDKASKKSDKASKRAARASAAKKNAPAPREAPAKPTSAAPVHTAKPGPSGNRLLLSIPRLGLENLKIGDSSKQSYLNRAGIMHLSGTGFPSQRGSNTYIAGHAEGYTTSRIPHVFRNLKDLQQGDHISLRDSTGKTYDYRVYESFVVTPSDYWVTKPVAGKQIVSLQTCFPAPTYDKRLIVRGILVS